MTIFRNGIKEGQKKRSGQLTTASLEPVQELPKQY